MPTEAGISGAESVDETAQYLDQRDLFSKLKHFKPIAALSAADMQGLEPEDVQFLVNAQMTGNEQQRLMFGTAINHLQGQQQRMDQAKTAVAAMLNQRKGAGQ